MVKFINESLITEERKTQGVLVVDTTLQGLWEFNELTHLKKLLPKTFTMYKTICRNKQSIYKPGSALLCEENGWKVMLLFSKSKKSTREEIATNLSASIKEAVRLLPSDVYIYSPILGRDDKCFDLVLDAIRTETKDDNRNWMICSKPQEKVC